MSKKEKSEKVEIKTVAKGPNKWILFLRDYCKNNNIKYRDAMKDPKCKEEYQKSKK